MCDQVFITPTARCVSKKCDGSLVSMSLEEAGDSVGGKGLWCDECLKRVEREIEMNREIQEERNREEIKKKIFVAGDSHAELWRLVARVWNKRNCTDRKNGNIKGKNHRWGMHVEVVPSASACGLTNENSISGSNRRIASALDNILNDGGEEDCTVLLQFGAVDIGEP